MSLKKNIMYSGILTVSLYILQFITFPYVSRVLGVASLGMYNYYSGLVAFFTSFSTLGISVLGIREIAREKDNIKEVLHKTFSSLFLLNVIFTILAMFVLLGISIVTVEEPDEWKFVGLCELQLLSNLFIIEWFFRGLEEFKFITIRTLLVRLILVACTFLFIKNPADNVLYFALGTATTTANALINWLYRKKYARLVIPTYKEVLKLLSPSILLGGYLLIGSYYNTIYPFLLRQVTDVTQVGFFTTATKLLLIILLLYNAYTQALVPRISLLCNGNSEDANVIISKSFGLLFLFAVPLMVLLELLAPTIIAFISGSGYEGAVLPMRIAAPVILVGGINQIITNQILLPYKKDREIIISYILGLVVGLFVLVFIYKLGAVAFSIAWLISELVICFSQIRYMKCGSFRNKWFYYEYIMVNIPLLFLLVIPPPNNELMSASLYLLITIIWCHIAYTYIIKSEEYTAIINILKIIKV